MATMVAYERRKVPERVRPRLGDAWERKAGIYRYGMQFAAKDVLEEGYAHQRSCPVHAVKRDTETAGAYAINIDVLENPVEMQLGWAVEIADHAANLFVRRVAHSALVV